MASTSSNVLYVKFKECGKIFIRENSDHIEFHCTFCDDNFQNVDDFRKHVKSNHRFDGHVPNDHGQSNSEEHDNSVESHHSDGRNNDLQPTNRVGLESGNVYSQKL